jgi:ribosomal-protein-alanine N-acetyltransferase
LKPLATTLTGKRVSLRPPVLADYEELVALVRKSRRFYRGFVTMPFKSRKQFAEYAKHGPAGDKFRFMICRRSDGAIVGSIGLFHIVRLSLQSGVVGYMVGAPFARQGFAGEALQLVLQFAFKKLKLHRVEANIQPGNVASIGLAKRAGFNREGCSRRYLKIGSRWRDHERWAILAEDWQPIRIR